MAHERLKSLPLGEVVAEQRQQLSLSLADVARRVRNAAKAEGRQCGATRQWVSQIEPAPPAPGWASVTESRTPVKDRRRRDACSMRAVGS
jgi:hypothetical protein